MKELSGSLSRNDRKEKDSHPDYKGSALIGDQKYWIAGWVKENDKGKWLSLAFTVAEDKPAAPAKRKAAQDDEEIPF